MPAIRPKNQAHTKLLRAKCDLEQYEILMEQKAGPAKSQRRAAGQLVGVRAGTAFSFGGA